MKTKAEIEKRLDYLGNEKLEIQHRITFARSRYERETLKDKLELTIARISELYFVLNLTNGNIFKT